MKRLLVVAAVIRRGGEILITRRPDRPGRPGQWEFPGGKVEAGEGEPEALRRELREELACEVEVGPLLVRHGHRYPEFEVELAFYAARLLPGAAPSAVGVSALAWAPAGRMGEWDFLEADRAVLPELDRASAAAAFE